MILSPDEVREVYRRIAPRYDRTLWLYRALGLGGQRRKAIRALQLMRGETAIDLCCGTGANLGLLREKVGPSGRVIGVDISEAMLAHARQRIETKGWGNVELVQADVATWTFPEHVHATLATFGLEMVPEYDSVIRRTAAALAPGGRLVLFGLRHPEKWPEWLIKLAVVLNRKYGVSRDYESFRPWTSVAQYMEVERNEIHYLGAAYMCIARKRHQVRNGNYLA
jgi:ubiquinone/menaquinone biosynthesis C-methylase UbiE